MGVGYVYQRHVSKYTVFHDILKKTWLAPSLSEGGRL